MISLMMGAKVHSFNHQRTEFEFFKVTCARKAGPQIVKGLPEQPFILEEHFQLLILDLGCPWNRLK